MAGGHAHEEVGQHRLAHVHRVQQAAQARVGQAQADDAADVGLELPDQIRCGSTVAGAHRSIRAKKAGSLGMKLSPQEGSIIKGF